MNDMLMTGAIPPAYKQAVAETLKRAIEEGLDYGNRKYLPVKDRLEIFRRYFGLEYGISTDIRFELLGDGRTVIVAGAQIGRGGEVFAAGHGMVYIGVDEISSSAPVEAAETFAIGRALACFGLIGSEYASANEMDRVKAPAKLTTGGNTAGPLDDLRDKYAGMPNKEAEFRKAVDEHFPPSIGQYKFLFPSNNSPQEIDIVFREIDRIEDANELGAYYDELSKDDFRQWVAIEDWNEIKASFKSRDSQLRQ